MFSADIGIVHVDVSNSDAALIHKAVADKGCKYRYDLK